MAILADGTVLFLPATGGVYQVSGGVVSRHPSSSALEADTLLSFHPESDGVIWFETGTDLVRWERGRVQRFGPAEGPAHRALHYTWASDAEGRTWIGGPGFAGYYEDGRLQPVSAVSTTVYRVASARSGGVWIFGNELAKWEEGELKGVAAAPFSAGRTSVRCLYEDRSGALWCATSREGVYRFDGGRFQPIPNSESSVESVTEDREGNIWLGTDSGLRRLRTKAFVVIDAPVTNIAEDDSGAIWLAGRETGVVRRTGATEQAFRFRSSQSSLPVMAVCADHSGRLWMGTSTGLFQATVADPTSARRIDPLVRGVRIFLCTRSNEVWASNGGTVGVLRDGRFLPVTATLPHGHDITALTEDSEGSVICGTSHGSVLRYESAASAGGPAWVPVRGAGLLPNATIHAILPLAPEETWVATTDGLVLLANGHVRRFTPADGLPDDIVLQLLPGASGSLWLATPRGLYRVSRHELLAVADGRGERITAVTYGPEQGLSGVAPTTNYQPAAWRDRRGQLWFCTYKGVIMLNPEKLQHDALPPPVYIDAIRIDETPARVGTELRAPPGTGRLEFRFSALSFAAPERVQIRHRLEGFDSDWIDTPGDRRALYAGVPPGTYRLRVMACNSEGVWNRDGASLRVIVLPTWWQTGWFRATAVLGFAGLVGCGARYWSQRKLRAQLERLEREHALEKERARIARDMHDELGGTVTGINLLVQRLRGDAESSPRVLETLDRRVRRLTFELERVVWTVSPQHTSLDQLATFIERFARNLFMDSTIVCRVEGRDTIPARPLTPECQHHVLAITKEAINNVLKHSGATEATVQLTCVDEWFAVSVADNGRGFVPESAEHAERNGLRNMQARVAEVGGELRIRSAPAEGTVVTVRVRVPAHDSFL
jgi:signal transduction histidine kinase